MYDPSIHKKKITVLTAAPIRDEVTGSVWTPSLRKRYYLDDRGRIANEAYSKASQFSWKQHDILGIKELGTLLEGLSTRTDAMLIRGGPAAGVPTSNVRRTIANFPAARGGCPFVMLDIDGWAPPDGFDPNSGEAIESFIALLPTEFRQASYWYQFSSSAGLMQPDGSPYKRGVRVHLFFWLAAPVQDHLIKAYLQIHCYEQHLCTLSTRDGPPLLTPWIDMALFNPVQPHYIALPQFDSEVVSCTIPPGQRQGLVAKAVDHVAIPPINEDIVQKAQRLLNDRKHALNFYLGKQRSSNLVRTDSGLYQRTNYWSDPSAAPQTDRGFRLATAYPGGQVRADTTTIVLYFDWEGSPGSWFVKKAQPTIARRFGDEQTLPLRELSEGAYAYVRDNLRWFNEIDSYDRPLDAQGFLPGLATFANHRVNLVLAPTGSGKTKAIVDYIVTRKTQLFFYAAPTRALVAQMQRDLEQAGVAVRHYKDVNRPGF